MMSISAFNKILKLIDEGKTVLAVKGSYGHVYPKEIRLHAKSDMEELIGLAQSNDVSFYVCEDGKERYWEMEEIK